MSGRVFACVTVEDAAVRLIEAAACFQRVRAEIDSTVPELEARWAVNRAMRQSSMKKIGVLD